MLIKQGKLDLGVEKQRLLQNVIVDTKVITVAVKSALYPAACPRYPPYFADKAGSWAPEDAKYGGSVNTKQYNTRFTVLNYVYYLYVLKH